MWLESLEEAIRLYELGQEIYVTHVASGSWPRGGGGGEQAEEEGG